ncbi:MAG: nuclear transport factor 2 family protein [Polyangiales bacterium]
MTTSMTMSRRNLIAAGVGSLAVACGGATPPPSSAATPGASRPEEMVRKWYAAWESKSWGIVDALAADDFTFSSAAGDDHISKSTFKSRCWDTQSARIDRFDLESVVGNGNEVFVKYVCRTKDGSAFRNVEHFTIKGDRISALECYFGNQTGYPSAADKAHG